MRRFKVAFLASCLALSFAGSAALACPGHESEKAAANDAKSDKAVPASAVTAAFRVDGMHCAGCDNAIHEALNKMNGVYKVDVKMADKRVIVAFDKSKVTAEAITKAINDAGFKASAEV